MKIKITVMVLFLLCAIAGKVGAEEVNGYFWQKEDKFYRANFLTGFIIGHRLGEYNGRIKGQVEGLITLEDLLQQRQNKGLDMEIKLLFRDMVGKKIMNNEMLLSAYSLPNPEQMIDEVDAFYTSYPICKKMRLDMFLSFFIETWNSEKKKTYEEVAESCKK